MIQKETILKYKIPKFNVSVHAQNLINEAEKNIDDEIVLFESNFNKFLSSITKFDFKAAHTFLENSQNIFNYIEKKLEFITNVYCQELNITNDKDKVICKAYIIKPYLDQNNVRYTEIQRMIAYYEYCIKNTSDILPYTEFTNVIIPTNKSLLDNLKDIYKKHTKVIKGVGIGLLVASTAYFAYYKRKNRPTDLDPSTELVINQTNQSTLSNVTHTLGNTYLNQRSNSNDLFDMIAMQTLKTLVNPTGAFIDILQKDAQLLGEIVFRKLKNSNNSSFVVKFPNK
ncbi:MAG: hypothetical protein J0H68_01685 [Sphingobacteriia bacterium]|nr:hypothetical protein [Sphingobacteriia bacterium]